MKVTVHASIGGDHKTWRFKEVSSLEFDKIEETLFLFIHDEGNLHSFKLDEVVSYHEIRSEQ